MKSKSLAFAASALVLGIATLVTPGTIEAQPMWDRVDVTLPYSVTIGDKTLQPGDYVIQQLASQTGSSQVLLIYGDNGMKFETSVQTIPALQNRTQPDTRVVLHHIGNAYYFDKVWVQGKDYGYEFPLPNSVKQRENEAMQPVEVTAKASSIPATPAPAGTATQTETMPDTTAAATTQTDTSQAATANSTPAQTTTPQPAMQPDTTASQSSADRSTDTAPVPTPAMPHTDAGWSTMLLSGAALTGLGFAIRRRRQPASL